MHTKTLALFVAVSALSYFHVLSFSLTVPVDCNVPKPCLNARRFCPGIVIICRGSNQEIRRTGRCNCCNACFNISQVGGPCGTSASRFKCAKGLTCDEDDDICQE